MALTIWHISKYVVPPTSASVGARGFLILRELAKMGHRCVMITSDSNHLLKTPPNFEGPSLKQSVDEIDVHWLRTRKYKGAKSAGRILSWIDFEWRLFRFPKKDLPKPDVIVVSSLSLLTIVNGLWLRWRTKARLVFEVRDIWPLTITEEGGFSRFNPFVMGLATVEKLGYRHADAIVGTMPNLQEHVDKVTRRAAPVHCIPMGLDENLLAEPLSLPDDYKASYIPQDRFLVCHAGTIGITNGLETLLDCADCMKHNSKVHFLIVGDGDLKADYQKRCATLPNITFAPAVPKSMVQSVLQHTDLLYFSVLPSKVWSYGLSLNKLIDYMLAGKPVVASYTGYPSMVTEADSGTFVPAGDVEALEKEILRYSEMPQTARSEIGARGKSWLLENRTYPTLAQRYLEIMKELFQ